MQGQLNYFEADHGKGPCDGIGGTVRCLADDAVTQKKVVIQDPLYIFGWSQETQNESKIKCLFVSSEETNVCKKLLQERAETLKPVAGTMKVHAVNGLEEKKKWQYEIYPASATAASLPCNL